MLLCGLPRELAINENPSLEDDLVGMFAIILEELAWFWSLPRMYGQAERLAFLESWHKGGNSRKKHHWVSQRSTFSSVRPLAYIGRTIGVGFLQAS